MPSSRRSSPEGRALLLEGAAEEGTVLAIDEARRKRHPPARGTRLPEAPLVDEGLAVDHLDAVEAYARTSHARIERAGLAALEYSVMTREVRWGERHEHELAAAEDDLMAAIAERRGR